MSEKKMVTEAMVGEVLKSVMDPELQQDLVSLQMIKGILINGAKVTVTVELTTEGCPLKNKITEDVKKAVLSLKGVTEVDVKLTAKPKRNIQEEIKLPDIKSIIMVGSGKGGVGKSTVSVNLAKALSSKGYKIGLLDSDFYGPNIPNILGVNQPPQVVNDKIEPLDVNGMKFMSMGLLLKPGQALIWRGPMLHSAIRQFLGDVNWGKLDFLIIDLPPGTGDVQLSLCHSIRVDGALMVTTPQELSVSDVQKAIAMFRQLQVDVIGVIENMSYFECPKCGEKTMIFEEGGGKRIHEAYNIPLLAQIPLSPMLMKDSKQSFPYLEKTIDVLKSRWVS